MVYKKNEQREQHNEYKIPTQVSIPKLRFTKTGLLSKLESTTYPGLELTALQKLYPVLKSVKIQKLQNFGNRREIYHVVTICQTKYNKHV